MSHVWGKMGLLYAPTSINRHPKLATHAANPVPVRIKGDVFRIYFSGRDAKNRSSVGAVDIDIVTQKVLRESNTPLLIHGNKGTFYADGISIGNLYETDGGRFILFMGWQNPASEHWRGAIGSIRVHDDLNLSPAFSHPIMGADAEDPISLSYPWVERYPGGEYRMWYGSTISWDTGDGEMLHVIKQASSHDGIHWQKEGLAIPYEIGVAQAFSRPTVNIDPDGRHNMWYSYRSGTGTPYQIGYAHSDDGKIWTRDDDRAGIEVSDSGWDSEMQAYPFVFRHEKNIYMLYNGNAYGRSGFGLARLKSVGSS